MQVIDDDNLSRRCNLSLVLNSLLLDRDLTATWGKLHHVRGKFASGNNSVLYVELQYVKFLIISILMMLNDLVPLYVDC